MESEASSADESTGGAPAGGAPAAVIARPPVTGAVQQLHGIKPFEVNSKVLCSHTDNLFYEAKIITAQRQPDGDYLYTLHYQGWSKRYDERILHSNMATRIREYTPANLEQAKKEINAAKMRMAAFTKKKKQQQQKLAKMRTGFANSSAPGSNSNRDLNGLGTTGQPMSSTGRASSSAVSQSSSTSKTEAVTFPEKLKILLENDNRLVEGGLKMPKLPARVSVSRIFDEYVAYVRRLDAVCAQVKTYKGRARYWKDVVASLDECTDNMKIFFDLLIESDLLYPIEKTRYLSLTKSPANVIRSIDITDVAEDRLEEGLRASDYYGFIHLLRLIVKFQDMIQYIPAGPDTREILLAFAQSLTRYMGRNCEKFFDPENDYEPVPGKS